MQAALVLLTMLVLLGTMLSIAMLIAWRDFGRPRHALSWAAAFALISLQWLLIRLAVEFDLPLKPPASPTYLLQLAFSALLLTGFRQRAGRPGRGRQIAAGWMAVAIIMLLLVFGVAHRGLAVIVPKLASATLLLLAARSVTPRGRPRTTGERGAILLLCVLALTEVVTGLSGLSGGRNAAGRGRDFYFALTNLAVPPAFAGVGLFTVFLIAADISERMQLLARTDPLTGLLNRRGMDDALAEIAQRWRHGRRGGSVILADLDSFKQLNDRHGHQVGDETIRAFAGLAQAQLRRGELIGRIGGEEFALVLPATALAEAERRAEQLRASAEALRLPGHALLRLTVSMGVAGMTREQALPAAYAAALGRADAALLNAKGRGRNTVLLAPDIVNTLIGK